MRHRRLKLPVWSVLFGRSTANILSCGSRVSKPQIQYSCLCFRRLPAAIGVLLVETGNQRTAAIQIEKHTGVQIARKRLVGEIDIRQAIPVVAHADVNLAIGARRRQLLTKRGGRRRLWSISILPQTHRWYLTGTRITRFNPAISLAEFHLSQLWACRISTLESWTRSLHQNSSHLMLTILQTSTNNMHQLVKHPHALPIHNTLSLLKNILKYLKLEFRRCVGSQQLAPAFGSRVPTYRPVTVRETTSVSDDYSSQPRGSLHSVELKIAKLHGASRSSSFNACEDGPKVWNARERALLVFIFITLIFRKARLPLQCGRLSSSSLLLGRHSNGEEGHITKLNLLPFNDVCFWALSRFPMSI